MAETVIPTPIKSGANKPLPIVNTAKELNTFSKEVQKNTVKVKDSAFSLKTFIKETNNATKKIANFFSLSQVGGMNGNDKSIGLLEEIKNILGMELDVLKRKAVDDKEEDFRRQEEDVEKKRPGKNPKKEPKEDSPNSYIKSLLDNKNSGIFNSFGLSDLYALLFSPKLILGALGLPKIMGAISKGLTSPMGLMAAAAGYKILDAYENAGKVAGEANTTGIAGGLASFMGGDATKGLMEDFGHLGNWALMGAAAGMPFGPVGMIAGAILGGGLGALGKWISTNRIADWIDQTGIGLNQLFDVFSGNKNLEELNARIEKTKAQIQMSQESWKATNDEIIAKEEELRNAKAVGDQERIIKLGEELANLYAKREESVKDSEAESQKLATLMNSKEIQMKEGFMSRLGTWFDQQAKIAYGESFSEFGERFVGDWEESKVVFRGIWDGFIKTISDMAENIKNWFKNQFNLQTWIDRWNGKEVGDQIGSMVQPKTENSTTPIAPQTSSEKGWFDGVRNFFGTSLTPEDIKVSPSLRQKDDGLYKLPKPRAISMVQGAAKEIKSKREREDRAEARSMQMQMQSFVNNRSSVINSSSTYVKTSPLNSSRSPLNPTGY